MPQEPIEDNRKQSQEADGARDRVKFWSSFVRDFTVISGLLTLIGSAVAFFVTWNSDLEKQQGARKQQIEAQTNLAAANERDSKKTFLEMQAKAYSNTLQIISKITAYPKETDQGLAKEFLEQFFGPMALVEDERVEIAMSLFARSSIPQSALPPSNPPLVIYQTEAICSKTNAALILGHCMRISMARDWGFLDQRSDKYCNSGFVYFNSNQCGMTLSPAQLRIFPPPPADGESPVKGGR